MDAILHDVRSLVESSSSSDSTESLRLRLLKLPNAASLSLIDVTTTWTCFLQMCCDRLEALKEYLDSAEPRIVEDVEGNTTKHIILNHLNLEQTAHVAQLLEIIAAWALVPFLTFKITDSYRSKEFLALLAQIPSSVVQHLEATLALPVRAAKVLYGCLSTREIFQLVIDSTLVDMVALFVRLGFEKPSQLPVADIQWFNASFKALITNLAIPSTSIARVLFLHLSLQPKNVVAIRVLSAALSMLLGERSDGVYGVLSALLDNTRGVVDAELVAKAGMSIAVAPPTMEKKAYMERIIPQLLTIMRAPRSPTSDKYLSCACETFSMWANMEPLLTKQLWLIPLASPLLPFTSLYYFNIAKKDPLQERLAQLASTTRNSQDASRQKKRSFIIEVLSEPPSRSTPPEITDPDWTSRGISTWHTNSTGVVSSGDIVENVVSNLSLLSSVLYNDAFYAYFEPLIPTLVDIFASVKGQKKLEHIEKDCAQILQRFFKHTPAQTAIPLLLRVALDNSRDWRSFFFKNDQSKRPLKYQFAVTKNAIFLEAVELEADPHLEVNMDIRENTNRLIDLLRVLEADGIGELTGLLFLKLLEDLMTTMMLSKSLETDSTTTSRSDTLDLLVLASEKQLRIIHLLLPLIEQFGPSVLRDPIQICVFIKNMLEGDDSEIHILSLTILNQLLETKLVSRSEADILLIDLLSPLNVLRGHENEQVQALAQHCYEEVLKYRSQVSDDVSGPSPGGTAAPSTPKRKWVLNPHASNVEEALKMISSPLVPIRAGGLIQLRRFLLREDAEALAMLPKIQETFVQNLSNEDSYVYLGAIQGLSAVADVNFGAAMPVLVAQYRDSKRSLEIRLNVGEAILQVARRLGELLPAKAKEFFAVLFSTAQHDPAALMRASALSNLGELAELLKFGLLPYIEEIMAMEYEILQVERDELVRRGALNLLKQLFKGLSKDVFAVIPSHVLKLIQLLQDIEDHDRDIVAREHARVALNLYHAGFESAIQSALQQRNQQATLLEPTGYPSSLRFTHH